MQTEEFIRRVAQTPAVADQEAARKITLATIEALCLHLSQEEIRQMSSQLPRELSEAALAGGRQQQGEDSEVEVELSQFYNEVAMRAELPEESVQVHCICYPGSSA